MRETETDNKAFQQDFHAMIHPNPKPQPAQVLVTLYTHTWHVQGVLVMQTLDLHT